MNAFDTLEAVIAKMRGIVDALETDNAYLRKENAQLWDTVHEYQDRRAAMADREDFADECAREAKEVA